MPASLDPIDRRAAIVGMLVVLASNARYLAGFAGVFDPPGSMEPYYIDMAKLPVSTIAGRDPAWGPLYALWLKPLRAILSDPLRVYAANVQLLSYVVSALVYVFVLLTTRRAAVATGIALLFLVSDLNVPIESKVCSFAVAVVLGGVALSRMLADRVHRTAAVGLALLVAAYARPELYPPGIAVWLAALWQSRSDRRRGRATVLIAGSVGILAGALAMGTPVWSPGFEGGRLFGALREHFARNWISWNGEGTAYLSIWAKEFGEASGVLQAVLANPTAFARHLLENSFGVLRFFSLGAFEHFPLVATSASGWAATVEAVILALVAWGSILMVCTDPPRRRALRERCGELVVPAVAVVSFTVTAALIVFPKPHYLLAPGVILIIGVGLAASVILPSLPIRSPWVAMFAAVACVAATPTPYALPRLAKGPTGIGAEVQLARPVTDTVLQLRSLELSRPVHVLSFTDGFGELLGDGFEEIKIWNKGERSLEAYVRDEHVDVIVTMERGRQSFLVDDPYWTLIETTPERAGFSRLATADPSSVRVYLRDRAETQPGVSAGSR